MSLCLCDTNAQDDVHINDELVAENYAVFCPDNSPAPLSPAGQVHNNLDQIDYLTYLNSDLAPRLEGRISNFFCFIPQRFGAKLAF